MRAHMYTLVQRKKRQERGLGKLALISAPTVCQALCPALHVHGLIYAHSAEKCHVCSESQGSAVPNSELSA